MRRKTGADHRRRAVLGAVALAAVAIAWSGWAVAARAHPADTTSGALTVLVPPLSAPPDFELQYQYGEEEENISDEDVGEVPVVEEGSTLTLAFSSHVAVVPSFSVDGCPGGRLGTTIKLKGLPPAATVSATLEIPGHASVVTRSGFVRRNNLDYHVVAKVCQR